MVYPAFSEPVRVAAFNTELARKGPGLLLRDILAGEDDQVNAVARVIARTAPDILLLLDFDYDLNGHAMRAMRDLVAEMGGPEYPYLFAFRPNSGLATGIDMDGNGRLGEARDAQGYGRFNGHGGMAILSRFPILEDQARDFSAFLWRDLPGAIPPVVNDQPFPSEQAQAIQRLSSVGHWDVPVRLPDGTSLRLLAFHATTPVYDGPEDRNGRRNHDEIMFWPLLIDGALPFAPPDRPFVIFGDANLDPNRGQGRRSAIRALLDFAAIQDPKPQSAGASLAGDATDTVDWPEPRPGNLRVDYVLPSTDLKVGGSAVYWPEPGQDEAADAVQASRHRLVWVDLEF